MEYVGRPTGREGARLPVELGRWRRDAGERGREGAAVVARGVRRGRPQARRYIVAQPGGGRGLRPAPPAQRLPEYMVPSR